MTKDQALKHALEKFEYMNHVDSIFHGEFDFQINAIKKALAQPEQEPVNKYCCHFCFSKSGQMFLDRMIRCHECGNKRCPKATSHELPCTNSNEPNQVGSIYTTPPPVAEPHKRKPLSDEQLKEIWLKGKDHGDDWLDVQSIARAIEAAHGIKGEA